MRKVGFFVLPGYQPMGFAVTAPFETANLQAGRTIYDIRLVSARGGPIRTSLGFEVLTEPFSREPYDLLIIGASLEEASDEIVDMIREAPSHCRRIAATCHGAFVLAEAGLLNGRRATTHWERAAELRARYPRVLVDEDRIYVVDGFIWTSAGMTAGFDLGLAIIEDDLGSEAAHDVARRLILYHRRAGRQSQVSSLLELEPRSDRIRDALSYARSNLAKRLSVDDLAEVVHLSARQFSRAFQSETGQTPAKTIERLRLEEARELIQDTSQSFDVIARATGFGDRGRMRRAFLREFDESPHLIRQRARIDIA